MSGPIFLFITIYLATKQQTLFRFNRYAELVTITRQAGKLLVGYRSRSQI